MSSTDPNFLNQFESSLQKVQNLVQERQQNTGQYTQQIVEYVSGINGKLTVLKEQSDKIVDLVNNLKSQIQSCNEQVKNNQAEIDSLKQQNEVLSSNSGNAMQKLNAQMERLQQQINQLEQQLRESNGKLGEKEQQVTEMQNQITALQQEIVKNQNENTGSVELKKQKQMQLMQQMEELQKKYQEVMDQNQALQNQIEEKDKEIASLQMEIKDIKEKTSQDIQSNNEQLANLQKQNEDLVQRIVKATEIINTAVNTIDELKDSKREENLEMLREKFDETTNMIQGISNALQGTLDKQGALQGGRGRRKRFTHRKRGTRKLRRKGQKGGFLYGRKKTSKFSGRKFSGRKLSSKSRF
jgi:DNA repair exonuclease SbcCD ATPase subunit